MSTNIAVINKYPDGIPHAEGLKFAAALDTQLKRDYAPVWGRWCNAFYADSENDLPEDTWKLFLLREIQTADDMGALGRHDLLTRGKSVVGYVFVAACKANLEDWTVTASHEALEMASDPWINSEVRRFVPQVGTQYWGMEICDAVQGQPYEIDGVKLSNFVYPSYFIEGSTGPWDYQQRLTGPFTIAPTGYSGITTYKLNGDVDTHDVYGHACADWRKKKNKYSRRLSDEGRRA